MENSEHCGYTDRHGISRIHRDKSGKTSISDRSLDMWRRANAKARPIHVGLVGAGFAGLRCADVLLQYGCKVTILEARNRLGGRVAQSDHLGHKVDLGPNWIHGTENNPIMDLAGKTQTRLHAWGDDEALIDSSGKVLPPEEANEYNSLLWDDGVIANAFRYSNENHDSIDPQKSLYDFFVEQTKTMFADEPAEKADRKRKTLLQLSWLWSCYIGSPITRQSLRFFWLEECIEGENPFVAGTYNKILDLVAKPVREGAEILLETEVVRLSSSLTSDSKGDSAQPKVVTADGRSFSFDEVIITAPLGWLKGNKSAFEPELPERMSAAIDNISYGHLDKVYITFPNAFWNIPSSAHDQNSKGLDVEGKTPNVAATTSPLHQATSSGGSKHYAGFTHFLQPDYAPSTNPHHWNQECMNLAALPPDCAHPTLLYYIQGPQSKHIADIVHNAQNETERDATLYDFFEPYYSRLPNFEPSNPDCKPTAVLATAWANDKFAGYGSYSNFQIGLEAGDKDIEVMRHGMPERGLWIAGEHTAPFVALGTSTGAYWSGQKVAERIVEAYQLERVQASQIL